MRHALVRSVLGPGLPFNTFMHTKRSVMHPEPNGPTVGGRMSLSGENVTGETVNPNRLPQELGRERDVHTIEAPDLNL
jgi:hypothetical protein